MSTKWKQSTGVRSKKAWKNFFKTLKFSTYCIFHPFDGYWDLTREKRGSMGAATFIFVLALITRVLRIQNTSFQFYRINYEEVNIFMEILGIMVPFLIWVVSNWALTTLFDGKGTLKQVYMASAYAITPYPLIQLPLIILSNFITYDEGTFYWFFYYLSLGWCVLLIVFAMMMIHDYSLGKTILSTIFSVFGMAVIIFILLLFFSLIGDGISYFYSLYKEIAFRLY